MFGFLKDWKMAEIISLAGGIMSLLKEIGGKERLNNLFKSTSILSDDFGKCQYLSNISLSV